VRVCLTLDIRPSPTLLLFSAAIHCSAAVAVALLAVPATVMAGLWLALAASCLHAVLVLGRRCSRRIVLRGEGDAEITAGDDIPMTFTIGPGTVAMPWLTVLHLRNEGRRMFVPLAPDSMDRDAFRALRVWLRWQVRTA
jgi:hypothetical protein